MKEPESFVCRQPCLMKDWKNTNHCSNCDFMELINIGEKKHASLKGKNNEHD